MNSKCTPPDIMVCYRVRSDGSSYPTSDNGANQNSNLQHDSYESHDSQAYSKTKGHSKMGPSGFPLKQSKSRELRGGIMYTGCDCEKRNGLQDDCLRSECRGSPQCLTKPNPTCGPSEFSNGKHLELKRLHMEQVMKARHEAGNTSNNHGDSKKDPHTAYQNQNHADDCCCCCCSGEAMYHCFEAIVDHNQNQKPNTQGAAKCPGTDQCGPGICPVGECTGGVCAVGNHHHQKQNQQQPMSSGGSHLQCNCGGRGK